MLKKRQIVLLILVLGMVFVTYAAIAQEENIGDDLQGSVGSIWDKAKWPIIAAVSMFIFQGFLYIISLFKKDRLLKTLLNKYVIFHMKDGRRYQGTMRLDTRGAEIVSEESRQRGQAPSYIFSKDQLQTEIGSYIRYLDTMNDREKQERKWELDRLINPPLSYRIVRKTRNMFIELNTAAKNAISMVWGGIKQAASPLQAQLDRMNTAAKEFGGEAASLEQLKEFNEKSNEFLKEESYERIIERLVGTRVKIRIKDVKHADGEYMALFKDYNGKHMVFMNVRDKDNKGYRDHWGCDHEYKHNINNFNRRDDRGLRCRMVEDKEGRYFLVLENNTAYSIQVGKITLHDGPPTWERNLEFKWHIDPLSVRRIRLNPVALHNVGPFQRVRTAEHRTPRNYKKIRLEFRSFRDADVIFPRTVCTIIESAEKHQQELFSISALTDAILDRSESEEIAIQDAKGRPIHGMNLVHGYVTNVNEERIDLKSIDSSYSRRWEVESAYTHFDNALRHRIPAHRKLIPYFADRLVTQNALVEQLRENPLQKEALSQLAYPNDVKRRWRVPLLKKLPSNVDIPLPLKVMALTGNVTEEEFPILERFEYVSEHHMLYESVNNLRNDRLAKMDILWLGAGEIYKSGYRLNIDAEHRIKNFVSQGGVVIVSGQDVKTNSRQRRGAGWIPEPLTGVEYDETDELLPTAQGRRSRVFHTPNMLNTTPDTKEIPLVKLDDMWVDPLGKWNSLAKSTEQDASALLTLPFQKGLYIVTSLKNETGRDVEINNKLMENLLYFSVKWIDSQKWRQRFLPR